MQTHFKLLYRIDFVLINTVWNFDEVIFIFKYFDFNKSFNIFIIIAYIRYKKLNFPSKLYFYL